MVYVSLERYKKDCTPNLDGQNIRTQTRNTYRFIRSPTFIVMRVALKGVLSHFPSPLCFIILRTQDNAIDSYTET